MQAPRLVDRIRDGFGLSPERVGVVVVDHGSRRQESNLLLLDAARLFQEASGMPIVEPAHMELAEPSIDAAFARCVERGAELVVVFPYFLSPGRHWSQDIPALAAAAAARRPGLRHVVTSPLGLDGLLAELMAKRVAHCLARSIAGGEGCELCHDHPGCRLHG